MSRRRTPAGSRAVAASLAALAAVTALAAAASNRAASPMRVDVMRVPLGAAPSGLAAGPGGIWASAGAWLVRVDPDTGRVLARIRASRPLGQVVTTAGVTWVLTDDGARLLRVDAGGDPGVRHVTPPARVRAIAAGRAGVWVLPSGGPPRVMLLDRTGETVRARVRLPYPADDLTAARGAVLVTHRERSRVSVVDEASSRVVGTRPAASDPVSPLAAARRLWMLDARDATLWSVDLDVEGSLRSSLQAPATAASGAPRARRIASCRGVLFVGTGSAVLRFDPQVLAVSGRYRVPVRRDASVACSRGQLWITDPARRALVRMSLEP